MGDPCGIGPEVCVKAWQALRHAGTPFAILGDRELYAEVPCVEIEHIADAPMHFANALPILKGICAKGTVQGDPDPQFAPSILASIERAVDLVRSGQARAIVTSPIAKAIVKAAGFSHPGHTEFLGQLLEHAPYTRARGPVMMLAIEGLRVVPITVHCALRDVQGLLTSDKIIDATIVTAQSMLADFGISKPRIAVAALNPHAGENGAFGDEEKRIISPAIAALQTLGHDVSGPYPADTLFHKTAREKFDVVMCMYHDQALIPLKTLDFWGGVNITLGLPIVRTSPDHGTGFDIAGKGIANAQSMIAAIEMASQLSQNRAFV
jgi:4-hydroxythreonine-4-phosphate dehydrogenase